MNASTFALAIALSVSVSFKLSLQASGHVPWLRYVHRFGSIHETVILRNYRTLAILRTRKFCRISETMDNVVKEELPAGSDTDSKQEEDVKVPMNLKEDAKESDEGSDVEEIGNFQIAEVAIELDENLKSKLTQDLSAICSLDGPTARKMLETHKWNMQRAIDSFFDANSDDDENNESTDSVMSATTPVSKTFPAVVTLDDVASPGADCKKEKEVESEKRNSGGDRSSFSSWAPEKLSVISWNLDGLDDKNLEKRTDAVIEIILKENHDIVFFQELLPYTFDYIGRRLCSKYMPIPGTDNPQCEYLTGTFLKLNHVHYDDHYIIPYPNTAMQRNLLVTKAFIGKAKIALLNTHLESTAEFGEQRKMQLKNCFEVAMSFPPDYNVLFGGDLNLRDKEVIGLLPGSMSDLWVKCGSRDSCKYTWDLTRNTNKQMPSRFQPRCRFDRFYFRNSNPPTLVPEFFGVTGIEKVLQTQSFPSDHWAIIAFFRLSKEARKPEAKKRKMEECATTSTN
ncbi:Tyrosyl-DNA phosphodiesterase 2 [Orchesella cincta]|uniref:Tyrosyl-DNA phosphodiesterase 2 n=1 Tax=Orchesella cincta TaxID=48709 RepID=A0A1D2MQJ2_ORCCI|nr:Tyrosyl-DNA phosphodiesterase 2 [Orchesella cincta]